MIKIIYGAKGSGKTGKMIDYANEACETSSGDIVFLTDTDKYMHKVKYDVRLINVNEYDIQTDIGLSGFIRGLIACNHDIEQIYVDGVHRMTNKPVEELESFFSAISKASAIHDVSIIFTVSAPELPDYLNEFPKERV